MVCRYLENRICYDSSSGSGGGDQPDGITFSGTGGGQGISISADTMSENDARQGDTVGGESSSRFSSSGSQGERDALSEITRAGGNTYAPSNANVRAGGDNLNAATPQDPLSLQIQAAAADSSRRDFADPRSVDRSFFADAYDEIYGTPSSDDSPLVAPGTNLANLMRAGPMSQIFSAFGNNSNTADDAAFNVGQLLAMGGTRNPDTGAITGANAGDGTLGMNRFGMVTYSGMPDADYTGPFQNLVNPSAPEGGDNENAFPFANQQGQQVAQMAPGEVAPEAIDDLAINYLQNPYYAYSGFGNQFSPYGYAPGTLVDLLQTRRMTQPEQADTLGLFGNPTDFS